MKSDPWSTPPTPQEMTGRHLHLADMVKPPQQGPEGPSLVGDLSKLLHTDPKITGSMLGMFMGRSVPTSEPQPVRPMPPSGPDPVSQQIARVNAVNPSAVEPTKAKSVFPKLAEFVLHPKRTILKTALEEIAGKKPAAPQAPPSSPYPVDTGPLPKASPPPAPPPPQPMTQMTPELEAAQAASRARTEALAKSQMEVAPPAEPAPAAPAQQPIPTWREFTANNMGPYMKQYGSHGAAMRELSKSYQALKGGPAAAPSAAPISDLLTAPPPPPKTAASIFENAARGKKVSELAKAIDANASAHLGVDPMDPRFADALESLPQEWWDGMAQVAKINKPSPETVKQAVGYFRDRASQATKAVAK